MPCNIDRHAMACQQTIRSDLIIDTWQHLLTVDKSQLKEKTADICSCSLVSASLIHALGGQVEAVSLRGWSGTLTKMLSDATTEMSSNKVVE